MLLKKYVTIEKKYINYNINRKVVGIGYLILTTFYNAQNYILFALDIIAFKYKLLMFIKKTLILLT